MTEIRFTRQSDGTYEQRGELPPGTRRVRIQVGDAAPFGHYRKIAALAIIEEAIAKGRVRADLYRIVPDKVQPMAEETKAKLRQLAAERRGTNHT